MEQINEVKKMFNKKVNIWIGKEFDKVDKELMEGDDVPNLHYPDGTSIGKILIDIGVMDSWSQVKGSQWKDYKIRKGFTDLFLNGAKLQKGNEWDNMNVWRGSFIPHRVTIMNNS